MEYDECGILIYKNNFLSNDNDLIKDGYLYSLDDGATWGVIKGYNNQTLKSLRNHYATIKVKKF